MPRRHRIAIIEDHLLQRRYAERLIASQPDMSVVYSGATLPSFMEWLPGAPQPEVPDLLVLDLTVERQKPADPLVVRKLIQSGMRVILFTAMTSPPLVRQMLRAGVSGAIGKRDSEEHVLLALRKVLGGTEWTSPELAAVIMQDAQRPQLSDQEERALVLYASGLTMGAVAEAIGVQPGTAKKYIQRVRTKYAEAGRPAGSRSSLNRVATEDGYMELTPPHTSALA